MPCVVDHGVMTLVEYFKPDKPLLRSWLTSNEEESVDQFGNFFLVYTQDENKCMSHNTYM